MDGTDGLRPGRTDGHHRDNNLFMSQETCVSFLSSRKPLPNITRFHRAAVRKGRRNYETLDVYKINPGRTEPVRDGQTSSREETTRVAEKLVLLF